MEVGGENRAVFVRGVVADSEFECFFILVDDVASVHGVDGGLRSFLVFELDPAELARAVLADLGADDGSESGELVVELLALPLGRHVLDEEVPLTLFVVGRGAVPGEAVLATPERDVFVLIEDTRCLVVVIEIYDRRLAVHRACQLHVPDFGRGHALQEPEQVVRGRPIR